MQPGPDVKSMTAFAAGRGALGAYSWTWELRSVNGKGLDLRLRVPDWIAGLEAALRARLSDALARGNVTLGLRVKADEAGGRTRVNAAQLDAALDAMAEVEARAMERGLSLAPARPGDVLAVRGVLETVDADEDSAPLRTALLEDFEVVLADFIAMRAHEGAALHTLLTAHLAEIERLTFAATSAADARRPEAADALKAALARVMDGADGADPARIAQELALIAVKADITEEIDRLGAHVGAAQDLLASGAPVGRKLDFLAQEFNREANTLCSKAGSAPLTAIGLELKAAVDQLREQVQNVE
ncbi:YicC/YloC family endoribonuclease [Roseovarius sp. Pro17]|uniref:YicC/YloC family endoribonuclease n=1 Tax=Roseovarius sp. Pro17 TaxID=3108175 RepID=UPI002D7816F3|nr:YicC/YloC family endoribonuclease [Roseovarius sp. Pro17]